MTDRTSVILFCLLCLLPLRGAAQQVHRIYPAPRLTPEVQQIRQSRTPFRVEASEDVMLPTSVDNSKTIYFPPILNQSGGSCAQASGIGYMFTYELNRLLGRDASRPENRMSYLFIWNMLNDGEDQGGFVENGLMLAKRYGVMSEADYGTPFVYNYIWASGFDKYLRAMHNRAAEILSFKDSIPLIKRYLYDAGRGEHPGGILTYSTQATGWTFDDHYDGPSETGYHSLQTGLGTDGAHALTIVGYDDLVTYTDKKGIPHTGAFIVANSWGTFSHDEGRFYLPYDFFRDPAVKDYELSNSMNGVRPTTFEPKLVFRVGLEYSSRDDLRFGMATSGRRNATAPSTAYYYNPIFYHQGGDYNMQGQWRPEDIEIALDYSDYVEENNVPEQYFLNIITQARGKKMGTGRLTSLSVIDLRSNQPKQYPYRGSLPVEIGRGTNVLSIPLRPKATFSASDFRWKDADGNLSTSTFFLRTASGRYAKFVISPSSDSGQTPSTGSGQTTIHYSITTDR
ncbi:MAG: C1 family peptidase [Bacteroidaceae bacterium]|nr:C1 family peptidase [Bacteroidaceae bacterium]